MSGSTLTCPPNRNGWPWRWSTYRSLAAATIPAETLATLAAGLAAATPDYTGAELAAVVKMAARKTGRVFNSAALAEAVAAVRPLARG